MLWNKSPPPSTPPPSPLQQKDVRKDKRWIAKGQNGLCSHKTLWKWFKDKKLILAIFLFILMANGNGNIIRNSRIQLQLSDQYGEWEQRLHESGALPDQRRESAQLNVNKLTILRLSALIFSPFGVLSILWIKGVEGAPFLDIYLCSLWCPSAFNTLYMWLYCVHLVSTFCTICLKIAL